VNNFISGLILLFERPIHVGDIIEVGDLQGEVRRIGIRASTVRTDRGADIIVPNGQFISANVTNWTLNDQLQRLDLPVSVTYRVAVQEVVQLLETLAAADPRVLTRPSPQGLFISYGDNSLKFELRVWTDRFDDAPIIRSELTKAIYDALIAAGMAAPLPQGERPPPHDLESETASPSQLEERATPAGQERETKGSALSGYASPKSG
jgi:small-conductance mechanosensitive channel